MLIKAGGSAATANSVNSVGTQKYVKIAPVVSYRYPVYNTANTPTSGIDKWETGKCDEFTEVKSTDTTWGTAGQTTWYVVDGTVTIDTTVTVSGNVHLILKDGAKLTVTAETGISKAGINVTGTNSFTVYAQSTGASMGQLIATGSGVSGSNGGAGIGGNTSEPGGNITINGGKVTANGGERGAGIGGGYGGDGSNITINGGTVTATSAGGGGAGIGGGRDGTGSNITINGGTVTANGGDHGAGIGSGYNGKRNSKTVTDHLDCNKFWVLAFPIENVFNARRRKC